MKIYNIIRKIERIRFYVLLILTGIIFTIISGIIISKPKVEYISTTGIINLIETEINSEEEEESNVYVSYRDNNGILHEKVKYPSYSSFMKVGDEVTVLYDSNNPELIQSPGSEFIPYICLIIGLAAIIIPIIKIVLDINKKKINTPFENSQKEINIKESSQTPKNNESMNEYYFHYTGKLNQSYILETPNREPIYEATCNHIGLFTPYQYTFLNKKTGYSQDHKITHTTTKKYGQGIGNLQISAVSNSYFKIDDVDIWKYLDQLGYNIELKREGIKLNFDVLYQGNIVAHLEAAGTNILKDNSKNKLGDKIPGVGLYKVTCKNSDIDTIFLICFTVSRIEFF